MNRYIFSFLLFFSLVPCLYVTAKTNDSQSVARQMPTALIENGIISAVERYNAGDFAGAVRLLEDIIAADPSVDAAHYYLGLCRVAENDIDAAESELREAMRLDSSNFWYRYRLAVLYSVTGKEELTLAMFEDLVKDFPKKYELYYNMVELYMASGQEEKALETMDQIETVFGESEMTVMARFDVLRKAGREDEAYACLEEYNEEYSSPQILTCLGDRKLSLYDEEGALEYYNEALAVSPGYTPALLGKSEVYRMTRKYDEFFSLMKEFIRDENVTAEGKSRYLAMLTSSSGQNFTRIFRDRLDSLVSECEAMYPEDSTVYFMAGQYYFGTGREELGLERFRANTEKYPASLAAAANYAKMLMYAKKWDELAEEGRRAYERFPGETAFLELAGMGDYNAGRYGEVVDIYKEILTVAPRDSAKTLQAYSALGDVYYQTGEKGKAYKAYEEALDINPDYAPVLNNYAYFLSLDGKKLKKAAAMSRKTVEQEPDNATYLDTYGWILFLQGKADEAKPIFKNAVMLYGGKENVEILDHYAEVLFSLGEYDLAFLYWSQAKAKNNGEIADLDARVALRKSQMNSLREGKRK